MAAKKNATVEAKAKQAERESKRAQQKQRRRDRNLVLVGVNVTKTQAKASFEHGDSDNVIDVVVSKDGTVKVTCPNFTFPTDRKSKRVLTYASRLSTVLAENDNRPMLLAEVVTAVNTPLDEATLKAIIEFNAGVNELLS